MPRGDGTGPWGMGPMTGRGAGYCAGFPTPGFMNPVGGRLGLGRGFGRGLGFRVYPYYGYRRFPYLPYRPYLPYYGGIAGLSGYAGYRIPYGMPYNYPLY